MWRIEPGLAACKGNTLPAVLFLQPLCNFFFGWCWDGSRERTEPSNTPSAHLVQVALPETSLQATGEVGRGRAGVEMGEGAPGAPFAEATVWGRHLWKGE